MMMGYRTTMQFIDLYRQHRSLWDKSEKDYLNKEERIRQREVIGSNIGMTERDVAKKISNLRTSYQREVVKRDRSLQSGQETYLPKWPYFFALDSFLNNVVKKRQNDFPVTGGPLPEMPFIYVDEQFSDNDGDSHDDLANDLSLDSNSGGMLGEERDNMANNSTAESSTDDLPAAKRLKTELVDREGEGPSGQIGGFSGLVEVAGVGGESLPRVSRSTPPGVYPVSLTQATPSPLPVRSAPARPQDAPHNMAPATSLAGPTVRPASSVSVLRASLSARGGGGLGLIGSSSGVGVGAGDGGGQGTPLRNTPSSSLSGCGSVSGTVTGSGQGNSASLPSGMKVVEEDDDWLFGRYIVSELKKVENFRDKQLAKMKIQQIVTYAQLGMGDSSLTSAPQGV